jgi:lipopolysaccharide export system permease protein
MLKQIDRLLFRSYLKSYVVCWTSLVSLFIIVDLFTNIDDFTHRGSLMGTLQHIAGYYGYRLSLIFDKLSEAITLLAAMFTVAWMQRNNELIPLLSAGVSTRRVVLPVVMGALSMLVLSVVNQELIMPRIRHKLTLARDDPNGDRELSDLGGSFEPNGIHIEARTGTRATLSVKRFSCLLPARMTGNLLPVDAAEARYIPPGEGPHTGGWLLTGVRPLPELQNWDNPAILDPIDPGKYFLHTREVDFDRLTRQRNWFQFISTAGLYEELQNFDSLRLASLAVAFHMRLTRPLLGMILVFLGLSVILADQNRNMFISVGLCLGLCALFFVGIIVGRMLGEGELLSPPLAAWLPVFVFGPLSFALFDAVQT